MAFFGLRLPPRLSWLVLIVPTAFAAYQSSEAAIASLVVLFLGELVAQWYTEAFVVIWFDIPVTIAVTTNPAAAMVYAAAMMSIKFFVGHTLRLQGEGRTLILSESQVERQNGVARYVDAAAKHYPGSRVLTAGALPFVVYPFYPEQRLVVVSPFAILRQLWRHPVDRIVVIEASTMLSPSAALAGELLGIPVLQTHHTRLDLYAPHILPTLPPALASLLMYSVRQWFMRYATGHLVVCPFQKDELETKFGAKNVGLLGSAVENEFLRVPGRPSLKPDREFTIGYVGRISTEKNVEEIVPIIRDVQRLYAGPVRFVAIGRGPAYDKLLDDIHALGVACEFTQHVPHHLMHHVFSGLDVLLFPSLTDTVGLVMLEALASGVPVVARNSAASEAVRAMFDLPWQGLLTSYYNPRSAAGLIKRCADTEFRRSVLREREHRVRWNALSWKDIAESMCDAAYALRG
jgi:glycosyltransferase involved in cell wall biosynthesis